MAEWMLGTAYHWVGRQPDAQRHCDRGDLLAAGAVLDSFGFDHRVRAFVVLARSLWIQGRWDRAVALGRKAIQEAERRGAPLGLCIALINTVTLLLWNGSLDEAGRLIARLEEHADRQALATYQACGHALRGELMGAQGEHEAAIERLRGSLARLHELNHRVITSGAQRALAESLMHAGHLDQARTVIDDAIDRVARSGGKFDLSELLRTQGEIRLRAGDAAGAEAALVEAIAVADEQGAKSWRLKSGEALARLRMSCVRAEEAQAEVSALLGLLDDCGPGEPLAATRNRLLALRAEVERSVGDPDQTGRDRHYGGA
jgi:ATP/maltotriose-dependent transcriptional regulator MalT